MEEFDCCKIGWWASFNLSGQCCTCFFGSVSKLWDSMGRAKKEIVAVRKRSRGVPLIRPVVWTCCVVLMKISHDQAKLNHFLENLWKMGLGDLIHVP